MSLALPPCHTAAIAAFACAATRLSLDLMRGWCAIAPGGGLHAQKEAGMGGDVDRDRDAGWRLSRSGARRGAETGPERERQRRECDSFVGRSDHQHQWDGADG